MLKDVVEMLVCPHCGSELVLAERCLRCAGNHVFDIARQGYVSLLSGPSRAAVGDTGPMVAARADFLAAGHFAPIADQVIEAAECVREESGCVLDVGAGTGYYLARVLERLPGHNGLALDVSKYACRRAARAHPRIGAVVADTWHSLPVRSAAASVVLNVFAPRNAPEMNRVLRSGGHLVVVTPNAAHLGALVSRLGLLSVDERKQERLDEQLGGLFEPVRQRTCEFTMFLRPQEVEAVVAMGPSAWHATVESLRGRIAGLPDPITVTASVTVSVYRRC